MKSVLLVVAGAAAGALAVYLVRRDAELRCCEFIAREAWGKVFS